MIVLTIESMIWILGRKNLFDDHSISGNMFATTMDTHRFDKVDNALLVKPKRMLFGVRVEGSRISGYARVEEIMDERLYMLKHKIG